MTDNTIHILPTPQTDNRISVINVFNLMVTWDNVGELTNKTIDALKNTLTNIDLSNLKVGTVVQVINTDVELASADKVASEKAISEAINDITGSYQEKIKNTPYNTALTGTVYLN